MSVSDERFLSNAKDARENGYELICSECGMPMDPTSDDEDAFVHEVGCPGPEQWAANEAAFNERLRRIVEPAS